MIQSMTGFGRGEATSENYHITVEMKSVNHRYCDVSVRMPRKLNAYESVVRNQVKSLANRGKIDVYVNFEDNTGSSTCVTYNKEIAKAYYDGICQICDDFNVPNSTTGYMISRFPEVFVMSDTELDEDLLPKLIIEATKNAGEQFIKSREAEGSQLRDDLKDKLSHLGELVDIIEKRCPQIMEDYRKKLTEKVTELLGDTRLDESVLATEIVVYADKVCVDEELVRLKTHINQMSETLDIGTNIGRKLDFITQEMNRESNTILSKSDDIYVSDCGIELKTEIEKIREQIQNIE